MLVVNKKIQVWETNKTFILCKLKVYFFNFKYNTLHIMQDDAKIQAAIS